MGYELIQGEAVETMRGISTASVDACVTDPPYELAFMGKSWDASGIANSVEMWRDVLRVLQPGGRLLAFGGARTHHRMACAIEDAGFMIEDCIMWVFGQGFPKHKSKLKPGYEPIVVARKGGASHLNIDACRIEIDGQERGMIDGRSGGQREANEWQGPGVARGIGEFFNSHPAGRWPANVILSHSPECREIGTKRVRGTKRPVPKGASGAFGGNGIYGQARGRHGAMTTYSDAEGCEVVEDYECVQGCPVRELDAQTAHLHRAGNLGGTLHRGSTGESGIYGAYDPHVKPPSYGDSGGASRFFYCAKASRKERGEGNNHPTVKPVALMRYLCRLVTPPNGLVLDPFTGSGTTGVAALQEGLNFVGIERELEYAAIARRRIEKVLEAQPLLDCVTKGNRTPVLADALSFVEPENADSPIPPGVTERHNSTAAGVVQ